MRQVIIGREVIDLAPHSHVGGVSVLKINEESRKLVSAKIKGNDDVYGAAVKKPLSRSWIYDALTTFIKLLVVVTPTTGGLWVPGGPVAATRKHEK